MKKITKTPIYHQFLLKKSQKHLFIFITKTPIFSRFCLCLKARRFDLALPFFQPNVVELFRQATSAPSNGTGSGLESQQQDSLNNRSSVEKY
jgi:hypothetical protein